MTEEWGGMTTQTQWKCSQCGYSGDAPVCAMCGALPPGGGTRSHPHLEPPHPQETLEIDWEDEPAEAETPVWGLPAKPFFFLVGAIIAPLFAVGSFMPRFGWFLGALFHESGHTATALAFGLPAFPAISLRGHAASVHQDQIVAMVFLLWAGLGYVTWHLRHHRAALAALGIAVVLYPFFAFTDAKEFLFLVGGHGGELAMATVCLWRALTGGFTHNPLERGLYSVLGWYLVGSNVWLCGSLATSAAARDWYAGSGSFGLTNDYIRLADVLGWGLPQVAGMMLLVSLLPLPLSWLIWHLRR